VRDDLLRRRCALAVMAKLPRAGTCKTRLVPPLTAEEAAALSRCFLIDTAHNVEDVADACGAVPVAVYTPPAPMAERSELFGPAFTYLAQRGDRFGDRLFNAVDDLLAEGYGAVCLIDSDSPTLPARYLAEAVRRLAKPGERIVIGPALDGGYYLLGVKSRLRALFHDIAWSTSAVFEQTCERARACGVAIDILEGWYDVDDAAGLEMLRSELSRSQRGPGYAAPVTRRYLAGSAS